MEKAVINANIRERKMKARKLKKEGKIPAVVYGKQTKSVPIEIKIKDIEKTVRKSEEGTLLITLKLTDNNEEKTVVIREVQRDPVTDEIIHADFHQISETEKTIFNVPVFAKGVAEGVKMGGILEHITHEVEIRCLPKDLPEKIEVDISTLKIGADILVRDLNLGENVEILDDPDKVLFTVVAPHKHEEETVSEEETKEPEVVKKKEAEKEESKEKEEK